MDAIIFNGPTRQRATISADHSQEQTRIRAFRIIKISKKANANAVFAVKKATTERIVQTTTTMIESSYDP